MSKPSPTKPSTPRLSEVAKFVHVPPTAVATGWPAVRSKLAELGIRFRWWQVAIAMIVLSKNAAGKYTTTIGGVGLSIPRQVGKTFLVGALVFALCLLRPGLTVVWSAHRLRTAEETFKKMQAFARRKSIKPHVLRLVLGSGEESIEFVNGSRIMFGARAAGFGRGFDEVDVVVYDEGQILDQSALDDMIPATNQCRQPEGALLFFMGTPPQKKDIDAGRAEVFTAMRSRAKAKDEDTVWVEFGADDGYVPTPSPDPLTDRDWKQIAKANPSFPDDTPRESILRMRKQLGDASFKLEGAGVWDEFEKTKLILPAWHDRTVKEAPGSPAALGVAVDLDRVWVSVGAASSDPIRHLGPVTVERDGNPVVLRRRLDRDRAWVVSEIARIQREHNIPVALDAKGPGESLIEDLEGAGVVVTRASLDDHIQADADLYDEVARGGVVHAGYEELNDAVAAAGWRKVGERRVIAPKSGDVSMLKAASFALWGAEHGTTESVYEKRGALVL